jgi:hypothetical protein
LTKTELLSLRTSKDMHIKYRKRINELSWLDNNCNGDDDNLESELKLPRLLLLLYCLIMVVTVASVVVVVAVVVIVNGAVVQLDLVVLVVLL